MVTSISIFNLSKFSNQIWAELIRKRKPPVERPELLLSLNYLPQAERLTVVLMKAKNLETDQDPYVKVNLMRTKKKLQSNELK